MVWLSLAWYSIGLVWALYNVGFWQPHLIKETVVWFVFTAIAYVFQFQGADGKRSIATTVLRDAISALIIIELLVDTYTFHLIPELILVPIFVTVALLGAVPETKPEHKPVAKLMQWTQIALGFVLVFYAVRQALGDPALDFEGMAMELFLPVFLSIGTIPYIYALILWITYDGLPWRFGRTGETSAWFRHRAAAAVILHSRFHPAEVRLFLRRNGLRIHEISSMSALRDLLLEDRPRKGTDASWSFDD